MFSPEGAAACRGTCLVDDRGPLCRRFGYGSTGYLEEFALVSNVMNLGVVSEHTGFAVDLDGTVFPAAFQELINTVEVVVGVIVATIMFHLVSIAHIAGSRWQIAGHHVPTNTAIREVIESCQATGKRERMLVGGPRSNP